MKTIVRLRFGSHLYGTATPASDSDIKAIYLPCAEDILLQRVQHTISQHRLKETGERNTADDVDFEAYSPTKYLHLLAEGQTVALDMLFAPSVMFLEPPLPLWDDIRQLAPKLFTKGSVSFVRYCRQQANKYGIKGSRVSAARAALTVLQEAAALHPSTAKLAVLEHRLTELAQQYPAALAISELSQADGGTVRGFVVCGKTALFTAPIKAAETMTRRLVEEYGARALAAERHEGIDWKALSHAVRVGRQAVEFLQTHHITFPRPEAAHLLAIKQGQLTFQEVAAEVEEVLEKVEQAAQASSLPETADVSVIDDFILALHRRQVMA